MELARDRVDIFRYLDELVLDLRHRVNGLRIFFGHLVQVQFQFAGLDREDRQPLRQVVMELARQPPELFLLCEINLPASLWSPSCCFLRAASFFCKASSACLRSVMSLPNTDIPNTPPPSSGN